MDGWWMNGWMDEWVSVYGVCLCVGVSVCGVSVWCVMSVCVRVFVHSLCARVCVCVCVCFSCSDALLSAAALSPGCTDS